MPVVLLAHGSPDRRHSAAVERQAQLLRDRGIDVHTAFLEHGRSLAEAVATVPDSTGTLVVIPLLIAQAFHALVDVPREVTALELDDVVVRGGWLNDDVVIATLDDLTPREITPADHLIVVTAGSSDETALDADERRAETFARHRGVSSYAAAFASGPRQRTSTAIAAAKARGVGRIHVVTVFLAPGVLLDRVIADSEGLGPHDSLTSTPLLGTDHITTALRAAAIA